MVNNVVLAGRYVSLKKDTMTLSITITKGDEKQDTLLIPIILNNILLKHVKEYVSKGDVVGVKGYLDNKNKSLICVAEKIIFLSCMKK